MRAAKRKSYFAQISFLAGANPVIFFGRCGGTVDAADKRILSVDFLSHFILIIFRAARPQGYFECQSTRGGSIPSGSA